MVTCMPGQARQGVAISDELLFFVGDIGMREIDVFSTEQSDAGSAKGDGGGGIERAVDVGEQIELNAIGGDSGLIFVGGEGVFEKEELALEFEVSTFLFGIGIHQHMAATSINHDGIAGLHLAEDVAHAADGGNAFAASDNRRVAGLAAGLRDDAFDLQSFERDDLRGEEFVGDEDHGMVEDLGIVVGSLRDVSVETNDDVAQVVHPFAEVFVRSFSGTARCTAPAAGGGRLGR